MAATSPNDNVVTASTGNNEKCNSISELLDMIYLDTTPTVDDGICKTISKSKCDNNYDYCTKLCRVLLLSPVKSLN